MLHRTFMSQWSAAVREEHSTIRAQQLKADGHIWILSKFEGRTVVIGVQIHPDLAHT